MRFIVNNYDIHIICRSFSHANDAFDKELCPLEISAILSWIAKHNIGMQGIGNLTSFYQNVYISTCNIKLYTKCFNIHNGGVF